MVLDSIWDSARDSARDSALAAVLVVEEVVLVLPIRERRCRWRYGWLLLLHRKRARWQLPVEEATVVLAVTMAWLRARPTVQQRPLARLVEHGQVQLQVHRQVLIMELRLQLQGHQQALATPTFRLRLRLQ